MSFVQRDYHFETMANGRTAKKFSTIASLKKILKPFLRILKKNKYTKKSVSEIRDNNYNTSLEDMRNECAITEEMQNDANEALEQRLHDEISECADNAAVYTLNGSQQTLLPVERDLKFIPVHFARTRAGTFFWTTLETAAFDAKSSQQIGRWVQA